MMRKLTDEHKKAISAGLLKASAEGRIAKPSKTTREKGLLALANLDPEKLKKRAAKAGMKMKGRPQRIDAVTGATEKNIHAKEWEIKSPEGIKYKIKNLNNFIRENNDLFAPEDVIWNGCTCRASVGLHSLNLLNKKTGLPRAWSWKGWSGYSVTMDKDRGIRND